MYIKKITLHLFYKIRMKNASPFSLFLKKRNENHKKGNTFSDTGESIMVYYKNREAVEVTPTKTLAALLVNFSIGVMVYPWVEIFYRGYTHISMAFAGGLAMAFFAALGFFRLSRLQKMLLSCLFILILELNIGLICNILLRLFVWDYGALPFSFCGQICLFYAVLWFLLALPCGILAEKISAFFMQAGSLLY